MEDHCALRLVIRNELDEIVNKKGIIWRLKSKIKWARQRDVNSYYFHKGCERKKKNKFH